MAEGLFATDRLDFETDDGDVRERFRTRYENFTTWLQYETVRRRDLFVLGRAFWSHIERRRAGAESGGGGDLTLNDLRRLNVLGLAFDWNRELGRHEPGAA